MTNTTFLYRASVARRPFFALFAAVLCLLLAAGRPALAQDWLISAEAGSGSNTYYFALDFRDFDTPQSYAFAYHSDATSLTVNQILQGLTAVPTFNLVTHDTSFGPSLDVLGYDGKSKGSDPAEPRGYWSQWNSPNGIAWGFNNDGIGTQQIGAGTWAGASWVSDYETVNAEAPRVPLAGAAVPEAGTLGLMALGMMATAGTAGVVRRRRGQA